MPDQVSRPEHAPQLSIMTLATRTALFAAFCVAIMLAYANALRALYDFSRGDPSASHLVLIPFVSVALVIERRKAIFSSVRTDWLPALGLVLAGLAVLFASMRYAQAGGTVSWLTAAIASLAIMWSAGFMVVYGRDAFRAALFPLGFLVFMIPIPPAVLGAVVWFLKVGSTEAVAALLTLTGTSYHREGFVFSLPSVAIEIADECSGIRSSIALLLTSLLAGYMYLRNGWSRALLVAAVLPVAVLKNGIRITSLALLSIHVNPSFLEGRLHHDGGVVFFLISLAILAPVLILLRRAERDRPRSAVLA
jgi:exosortase